MKKNIPELARVVLSKDLPEHGLVAGDIGCVVFVHNDGEAFIVEFCTLDGATVAIETVMAKDVTVLSDRRGEISHARPLAS